jgi:hypothetical protein
VGGEVEGGARMGRDDCLGRDDRLRDSAWRYGEEGAVSCSYRWSIKSEFTTVITSAVSPPSRQS